MQGASNDFQQCTQAGDSRRASALVFGVEAQVAKAMVMQLGMSAEIGQRLLGGQQGQGGPFMGRSLSAAT